MFDFDFCLNIGHSKSIWRRQPFYDIHERNIMNAHIQILKENDWICDCEGD